MKSSSIVAFGAMILVLFACGGPRVESVEKATSTVIPVFEKFTALQLRLDNSDRQLQVLNFWMTSCPPCVREMPYFNQLAQEFEEQGVEVLLVSLDRARDMQTRVLPFIEKHNILADVVLLEDQDYSAWTGIINSQWYGALPATLIIHGDQKFFKFGAYESYEELKSDMKKVLNKEQ